MHVDLTVNLPRTQVCLSPLPVKDIVNIATEYSYGVNNPCICVRIVFVHLLYHLWPKI